MDTLLTTKRILEGQFVEVMNAFQNKMPYLRIERPPPHVFQQSSNQPMMNNMERDRMGGDGDKDRSLTPNGPPMSNGNFGMNDNNMRGPHPPGPRGMLGGGGGGNMMGPRGPNMGPGGPNMGPGGPNMGPGMNMGPSPSMGPDRMIGPGSDGIRPPMMGPGMNNMGGGGMNPRFSGPMGGGPPSGPPPTAPNGPPPMSGPMMMNNGMGNNGGPPRGMMNPMGDNRPNNDNNQIPGSVRWLAALLRPTSDVSRKDVRRIVGER